jgi:hypothetical protein
MSARPGFMWVHSHGQEISEGEMIIVLRPQSGPFKISRILIPDTIASRFSLCNVMIGNISQFTREQYDTKIAASRYVAVLTPNNLTELRKDHGPHPFPNPILERIAQYEGRGFVSEACQVAQDIAITVVHHGPSRGAPSAFEAFLVGSMMSLGY